MPLSLDPINALRVALAIVTVAYLVFVVRALVRRRTIAATGVAPTGPLLATGFVTNFLDTLGVGSFATTTAIFRQWKLVKDEHIPGTLNVGHTLPTIVEAFIYIAFVPVDPMTLIGMIGAAVIGAWLGAGVVARWSRRKVQIGMGTALLVFAMFMIYKQIYSPAGGAANGLTGYLLLLGLLGNVLLGMLMTIGIGLYAPAMVLVAMLGMNAKVAFPIMMGSCAFLMPVASVRFVKAGSFDPKALLGLAIGGVPGVLLAAFIVKSMPIVWVTRLVIVVVIYTAANMLRAARAARLVGPEPEVAAS